GGCQEHPDPAIRHGGATEVVDLGSGWWDGWEDDGGDRDKRSGVSLLPEQLHTLNHQGKSFSVKGPLNIERPPQGYPVIVQAGSLEDGRELAAATAEAIFTAWTSLEEAQDFYQDVNGRLKKYGMKAGVVLRSEE